MRLKLKPLPTTKALAATLASFTMCMAPVAQGAQAASDKQLINQFLKDTHISTDKQTVGEFWARVRQVFPPKPQNQMDQWVRINKNEPMPTVEATSFKGPNGEEQVRLNFLMKDGKTMTMTFTGDEERFVKINSVYLSAKDLQRYNNFDQIVAKLAKDPVIKKSLEVPEEKSAGSATHGGIKKILTGREFAKIPSVRSQAEYLMRLREAGEAADKVFEAQGKKTSMNELLNHDAIEYVWNMLVPDANAATGPCIAAGWIASYHQNSCARANPGLNTLMSEIDKVPFNDTAKSNMRSCAQKHGLPCNPMLYGFQDGASNTPYCVTESLGSATGQCNQMPGARLPQDKQHIIQSIVAAKGKDQSLCQLNGEKNVSQSCTAALESYTDGLRQHYLNAADFCVSGGLKDPNDKASWVTRKNLTKNQQWTCEQLKDRYFDLVTTIDPKTNAIAPPPIKEDNCSKDVEGTKMDDSGQCVCASTNKPPEKSTDIGPVKLVCPAAVVDATGDATKGKPGKDEECSEWSWCKKKGLYIGAGIATAALLAWLLLKKKKHKKKSPVYEPPAPVPGASVTPSPSTPGTVITNPSPAPTTPACEVPPNSLINNVCTPPTVVIPEPPPSEGGTTTGAPISSGVR